MQAGSRSPLNRFIVPLFVMGALLFLAACGGPTGPGGGPTPDPGGDSDVDASLRELGVDTSDSPRLGVNDEPIPEDYAPLGSAPDVGKVVELLFVGLPVEDDSGVESPNAVNLFERTDDGDVGPLHALEDAANPWVAETHSTRSFPRTLRDAVGADTDGDGFEEIVFAYMNGNEVTLKRVDDQSGGYAEAIDRLANVAGVEDLQVAAADLDGDGVAEVIVALALDDRIELLVADADAGGAFALESAWSKTLSAEVAGATLAAQLATGNLDYDAPNEVAVVVNEYISGGDGSGVARWFVFDDAASGLVLLDDGYVESRNGTNRSAVIADVSIGDVDADGLDEVVLGGLTNYGRCDSYGHLFLAFDDAENGLAPIGNRWFEHFYQNCPSYAPWQMRFVHVNTLDLDGDGAHEVQANQFLFASWADAAPWTDLTDATGATMALPDDAIFDNNDFGWFDRSSTDIEVGDVDGDGREDIIHHKTDDGQIVVWGVSQTDPDEKLQQIQTFPVGFENAQYPANAFVVPVNMDADSPILRVGEGTRELVFTEPIILAALAAAPCRTGIGQNVDACTTSFGRGSSSTIDASLTVTIQASVHSGLNLSVDLPFVPDTGVELEQTVTAKASSTLGTSYRLEKTITFTTGSMEDAVIFTTIPYDHYQYDVLSHPDPDLVGSTIDLWLPREPITLIADRAFYNAAIDATGLAVDTNVFVHAVGDPATYSSRTRKNQLLGLHGGLENGPTSVGQGGGDTAVRIAVERAISAGGSLGFEIERSVKVNKGPVMKGFSWGVGAEASLSVTSGDLTEYVGVVGSIDAANFADNQYSFGLFTYPLELDGQSFQVLD